MKYLNADLVKCSGCTALYDRTLTWERGYYAGTSENFTTVSRVKPGCCPVCGKSNQ